MKIISELIDNLQYENMNEYFEKLVESVKTINRLYYRLEALIVVGYIASYNGKKKAFDNARKYVCEMIKKLQPDFALKGLIKYMQRYCDFINNKYIVNYSQCVKYHGEVIALINAADGIQGGEKSLRNEAYNYCEMICKCLDKFKEDQKDDE